MLQDAGGAVPGRGVAGAGVAAVGRHAAAPVRGAGLRGRAAPRGAGRAHRRRRPGRSQVPTWGLEPGYPDR